MTPVLWRLLRTYRWRLAAAMGLQALAGLCSLLPWMLLAWLAEPLARGQAQPALLALVLLAVLAWLGCQALAAHLAHRVDADLCNDLRLRLLAHLQRLPLDWFGRQGPDGVARLVEQDVRALHQLIAHAPNDLSNLLVVPLVALLWLAWLHPWLLLFCLLPLVLAAAGFLLLRSARYRDLVLRRNAALERLSADYGEFAHNLLLARQYPGAGIQQGAEASAAAFGEAFGAWVKRVGHLAALVYVQLSTPWLLAWVLLGALALDALGVPLALGQACAFLLLLRALAAPVQGGPPPRAPPPPGGGPPRPPPARGGQGAPPGRPGPPRGRPRRGPPPPPPPPLQQVFDHAPLAEGRSTREPVDGAVALHGLGHAYEGVEVLADIDLELEDGSLVALVGPSGSGKSTLLHLLARYMDAQRGELEIGGLALKDMPDAVRHRHIALVGQQAAALEISLADNIALFRPDADLQEIRQAARDACLDERIMALPRGYDSVPGRDLQLSGGELQRLALARALLSPARLLLLDEPTSALDPQTARQVLRNLRERGGGRTRVIVAHRLAEVSDADLILVLVAGRLVERGEHAALLAADGAYARLWREQNGAEVAA
ncbi:ABC transporter ATP-binding protein/permease [Pseudomonas aeruginosa]|uniref:ATP-binding cassette domain-containing protein n=1 Tax=Pseudomonas aeruginosa TaxID=287 RepID=UPI0021F20D31|nr:ABC transporter ATP-binding protein [Pseudomonas aeruginosa]MCV6144803.1 ABC transporter ATP-binding protein/permease [Pseudomonas aeruginosa]